METFKKFDENLCWIVNYNNVRGLIYFWKTNLLIFLFLASFALY